jgi:hypothetical protein
MLTAWECHIIISFGLKTAVKCRLGQSLSLAETLLCAKDCSESQVLLPRQVYGMFVLQIDTQRFPIASFTWPGICWTDMSASLRAVWHT